MFVETILADALHVDDDTRRPASALAGQWKNRLGSTMDLSVDGGHRVHGTFHTAVGLHDQKVAFPITGFAEGEAISFCVDFGHRGSVASWSGHHVSDSHGERLVTLWHLAQQVDDPHTDADVWRAVLAGGDEFSRVAS